MWKAAFAAGVTALRLCAAAAPVNPVDLKWGPAPASLPRGATMAVLSGDPGKPGVFVLRLEDAGGLQDCGPPPPDGRVCDGDFG